MQLEHLFARNEKLPSWWANAVGHALSVMAAGFTVSIKDATHVHVLAGANDQAAVVAVEGRWRWMEAEVSTAHPGGADGTYDVFVTAADDNIVAVPAPLTDATDRSFALAIVAHGGAPGGVALARKVAEVGWAGGALTWIRQVVPGGRAHRTEHEPGGADQLTGLTEASMAAANKDGAAGTPSLRTLGAGAQQAAAGNDARLTDARTPTAHAGSHQPGGGDAMAVDAVPGTGSLRTLGGGSRQAAAGDDARLADARTPVGHHATHEPGGGDAMAVDAVVGTGSLRTLGPGARQAAPGDDARLTDARTPTAHAATHQPGGTDQMAVDAVAGTGSLRTLGGGARQAAPGNDARLSDARTPTAHAASHKASGADSTAPPVVAGPLPGAPHDGDEIYYDTGTAGVLWHLRYNATEGYWDFLGGSDLYVRINGATANVTGNNQDKGGPTVTVPLVGDYDVQFGADYVGGAATGYFAGIGISTGGTIDGAAPVVGGPPSTLSVPLVAKTRVSATAFADIKLIYSTNAAAVTFNQRWISVRPVRVR